MLNTGDRIARKISVKLRNKISPSFYRWLKWQYFGALGFLRRRQRDWSMRKPQSVTLYHFCSQKTGSRWLRDIFLDKDLCTYTGLVYHPVVEFSEESLSIRERKRILHPPRGSYVGPLYYGPEVFESLFANNDVTVLFVGRDPIDLVVSYFESMAFSHPSTALVDRFRSSLATSVGKERFILCLEMMREQNTIENLIKWKRASREHPRVLYLDFKDLVGSRQSDVFMRLLGVPATDKSVIDRVLERYSFENMKARDLQLRGNTGGNHYNQGLSRKVDEQDREEIVQVLDDLYGDQWRELSVGL